MTGRLKRVLERNGTAARTGGAPRQAQPLIWCHATTQTQATAFAELFSRLSEDHDDLLVRLSVPSPDVAAHVTQSAGAAVDIITVGRDDPSCAEGCDPALVIWTGSADYPALAGRLAARGVPMVLTDAHPPERRPWLLRRPALQRNWLGRFDKIIAPDMQTARWLAGYGLRAGVVETLGPLQGGTVALSCSDAELKRLTALLTARPVWLAAHCTRTEEPLMRAAHGHAMRFAHRLLLILVPDEPSEGPDIAARMEQAGFKTSCRSQDGDPDDETEIFIADAPDEMGLWYRLAPTSFLGRSIDDSGQGPANPFDAAALGSAILHGPNTGVHTAAFARLADSHGARQVHDADSLGQAVRSLIAPDIAALMAHSAWQVISDGSRVMDRLVELAGDALAPVDAG